MAPAQIPVFLSQKPSTEDGQFRVVVLRVAGYAVCRYAYYGGRVEQVQVNKDKVTVGGLRAMLCVLYSQA